MTYRSLLSHLIKSSTLEGKATLVLLPLLDKSHFEEKLEVLKTERNFTEISYRSKSTEEK